MNSYRLKDIQPGIQESFSVELSPSMEDSFREITGDINPLHYDDEFAENTYGVGGHVAFGMLTASFLSTLAGVYLPGKYSLIHSVENISFLKPVRAGDVLNVKGVVADVYEELRMIKVNVTVGRSDEVVLKARMKILVME
mgnify:CR=1 FL=1